MNKYPNVINLYHLILASIGKQIERGAKEGQPGVRAIWALTSARKHEQEWII